MSVEFSSQLNCHFGASSILLQTAKKIQPAIYVSSIHPNKKFNTPKIYFVYTSHVQCTCTKLIFTDVNLVRYLPMVHTQLELLS